jgi:hypothetical protein
MIKLPVIEVKCKKIEGFKNSRPTNWRAGRNLGIEGI